MMPFAVRSLAALVLVLLAAPAVFAGSLADAAADPGLAKAVDLPKHGKPSPKGEGPVPLLSRLAGPPARVGLVSFYLEDPGSATGSYYSAWREFAWLTQDGASHFAQSFHEQGIDALVKAFAGHGMTVLTPQEYLDSDAKKKAYLDFEMKLSLVAKAALSFMKSLEKGAKGDVDQSATAAGYRLFPAHVAATDPAIAVSLEELRPQLGVDALLVVKNGTITEGREIRLRDLEVLLFGPNPVTKEPGKKYIQFKEGQLYVDAKLQLSKPALVATFGKGKDAKIESESYEGYDTLLGTIAERTAAELVARIKEQ
jgi:hypothetical protein